MFTNVLSDKSISLSMRELMPLVEEELKNGKEVMLPVKGVSMNPFLRHNRDSIILTALNGREIKVGDLVMFRRDDGSYAMHRIYKKYADNTFDIVGDGQVACDKGICYDMLVAYVPRAVRNGKEVSCEKGFWRFIMTAYMKFRLKFPSFTCRLYSLLRSLKNLFSRGTENSDE